MGSLFNIMGLPPEIRVASMHTRNLEVMSANTQSKGIGTN
jgi:hypothetical protein